MERAKKILRFLLIATTVIAVVYAAVGTVSLLTAEFTSFPWWSNIVFTAIYFGPVILLEAIGLLTVHLLQKRKQS